MPMLENTIKKSSNGFLRLAKMNADTNAELAQALNVSNLPTCILVQRGRELTRFSGVPSQTELQTLVDKAVLIGRKACGLDQVDPNAPGAETSAPINPKDLLAQANLALQHDNIPAAAQAYSKVLGNAEWKAEHGFALAGLGKCALAEKQFDTALELAAQVRKDHADVLKSSPELVAQVGQLEIAAAAAQSGASESPAALKAKVAANPLDHESRHALALQLFGSGQMEEGLNQALELFKRDRSWNDEAAKKLCFKFFEALGASHELTKKGRRRLSNLMFI